MNFVKASAAALAITFVSTSEAATCPLLTDPNAPVWVSSVIGSNIPGGVTAAIEKIKALDLDPNFSQCLASTSIGFMDAISIYTNGYCNQAISDILPNFNPPGNIDTTLAPLYQEVKDQVTKLVNSASGDVLQGFKDFRHWAYNMKDSVPRQVCDTVESKIEPCARLQLIPTMFEKIFNNDCCDAFKADFISKYIGQELTAEFLGSLLKSLIRVPCSKQTPGFSANTQTCGYAFSQAMLDDNFSENLKALATVPNAEGCAASQGKSFKTTSGKDFTFSHGIGCCANSIDNIVVMAKSFPIVKTYLSEKMFADGQCATASELTYIKALLLKVPENIRVIIEDFIKDLCFHVANDYSKTCAQASTCKSTV